MTTAERPQAIPETLANAVYAVELDFQTRRERCLAPEDVPLSLEQEQFCWLDIDQQAAGSELEAYLRDLKVNPDALHRALASDYGGRHDYHTDCLHLTLTAGRWVNEDFAPQHVELLIGDRYLITLRKGPVEFMEQVRRHYSSDFAQFAKTPSFLLYDCWDHLINHYKVLLEQLDERLQGVQGQIFGEVDDQIFERVSDLTRDVLAMRKTLLASREVLHDITTRRSRFVAESSQPFLDRLSITLERMVADLTAEREMLAETLNLYMGMVSHRTNKIINRLTIVTTVFLPLSLIVSIYGTNFKIPEAGWPYGYLYLWVVVITVAAAVLWWMKRKNWW